MASRGSHSFGSLGFTLIELLVVIAIIGVVAAPILSALAGATDRAKSLQCLQNTPEIDRNHRLCLDGWKPGTGFERRINCGDAPVGAHPPGGEGKSEVGLACLSATGPVVSSGLRRKRLARSLNSKLQG